MKTFAMIPALAAAVVFSATGLLAQEGAVPAEPEAPHKLQAPRVAVANYNWSDMHLYLDRDGYVTSLGVIGSMETRDFKLPTTSPAAMHMRIVADPIGGFGGYVSPSFAAWPDELVLVTLENALGQSTLVLSKQN